MEIISAARQQNKFALNRFTRIFFVVVVAAYLPLSSLLSFISCVCYALFAIAGIITEESHAICCMRQREQQQQQHQIIRSLNASSPSDNDGKNGNEAV